MVRKTSVEAYKTVMESGYVGKRQREVYAALFDHGPCTAGELFDHLKMTRNPSHSNVGTRLGELRDDFGVVTELGKRECTKSGVTAIIWDVTSKHPTKKIRRTPRWKVRIEAAVIAERAACAQVAETWGYRMIAEAIRKRAES